MAIERRIRESRLVVASGSRELEPADSPGVPGWKFNPDTGDFDRIGKPTGIQVAKLPRGDGKSPSS